ncbi:MAG: hypothetical protein S4CHLAM7_08070 [Chlamydiae bacterium]|nr:hypothetical protein [Chlamydiota bacterium]
MKYRFIFKIFLVFALTTVLVYKTASWISLYPKDWFLDEKAYHNDVKYIEKKTLRHRFIINRESYDEFSQFFPHFTSIFAHEQSPLRVHKNRTVVKIDLNGKAYVLKRYNIKHFYNWLQKAPIRSSQAFRSWHYGHLLLKLGISTPKPILIFEERVGPFWTTSYVITEYVKSSEALDGYLEHSSEDQSTSVITQIDNELSIFKKNRLIHSDYGARNILVSDNKAYTIDLDDLHQYHLNNLFFRKKFFKKHLTQLK